jgi:hypothetical protein
VQAGSQITLPLVNPTVPTVERIRTTQLPVARIRSIIDKLRAAPVAQRKAGGFRVDASLPAIAHGQAHASRLRDIEAIDAALFSRESRSRRINLEIFFVVVEACEANCRHAFGQAESNALVAQGDNAQDRVAADAHIVARINLKFEARVLPRRGERIAFDERKVDACALPRLACVALQLDIAANHAHARDASTLIIFVCVIIIVGADGDGEGGEQSEEQEETGRNSGPS